MLALLVEDDDPKRRHILSFLKDNFPEININIARSVRSAIMALEQNAFDLVLLDISLDTYDRGEGESGGRPQTFGGTEVLHYMDMMEITKPVFVITGYEVFARDGKSLNHQLLRDEPQKYY